MTSLYNLSMNSFNERKCFSKLKLLFYFIQEKVQLRLKFIQECPCCHNYYLKKNFL